MTPYLVRALVTVAGLLLLVRWSGYWPRGWR